MKKSELRQIIKEEISDLLNEAFDKPLTKVYPSVGNTLKTNKNTNGKIFKPGDMIVVNNKKAKILITYNKEIEIQYSDGEGDVININEI